MSSTFRPLAAWSASALLALVLTTAPVYAAGEKSLAPTPGWQFESGNSFANAGAAAVALGDVNGDGFGDFAVGAPNYDGPGPGQLNGGAVFVFIGGPSGPALLPSQNFYSTLGSFGTTVAPAGDVNNDGYHDLLVGVPFAADGRAYLYLGSASGLSATPAWQYVHTDGGLAFAQFAASLAPAGDVNRDGYDDVVIGARFSADGAGAAFVFLGNASGLATTPIWTRAGVSGDTLGSSVSGAGDVNADGYADVVIGVPGADGFTPQGVDYYGTADIYHGGPGGLGGAATRLYGLQASAGYGQAVAGVGDVNGDGYADLAVGSPLFDGFGFIDNGRAMIYPGGPSGVGSSPIWEEYGEASNIQIGNTLASAGDVNGDGLADVVIGVPIRIGGSPNNGRAMLVQGGRWDAGPLFVDWFIQHANAAGFGSSVSTAGDVNGDGFSDLIVGSPLYGNGQAEEGLVELYYGAGNATAASYPYGIDGGQSSTFFGWSITSVGDINGDGFEDTILGGPTMDSGAPDVGIVYVYAGGQYGAGYHGQWEGESSGSAFGSAVARAGDVNGDGYEDVLIGAHAAGTSGKAYCWYGSPNGLNHGAADWSVSFGSGVAQFGLAVAGAGDVNHDGFADVIIGAPNDSDGQAGEGRAYVFHGSATGLSTTPARIYQSDQAGARLGSAVAGAGDVNRDGFSDVVIGVEAWDVPVGPQFFLTDAGRALVFHGGAAGLGAGPATILDGDGSFANDGCAVSPAGDIDGDGYADVMVAAKLSDAGGPDAGEVRVFRGTAAGVGTNPHWTLAGDQAFANLGAAIAGAGDVNGDGLSDVLIGAPFADSAGFHDNGVAMVFAGPLSGGAATTPIWSFAGQQSFENLGNGTGPGGDINGDGFADILIGSPGYTRNFVGEGRVLQFFGNDRDNAANTQALRPQVWRGDGSRPVALLGGIQAPPAIRLKAHGLSPAGRTSVRLEWEVVASNDLFDGLGLSHGGWSDNAGGPLLDSGSIPLPAGVAAHWQLRVASRSPYFAHSVWLSPSGNGRQQADVVIVEGLTAVAAHDVVPGAGLQVTVAPNPFNPRTSLRFAVAQAGQVRVELFDVLGRAVGVLLDEARPAGMVDVVWNGTDAVGRPVSSGAYFAKVTTAGQSGTARLVLIR